MREYFVVVCFREVISILQLIFVFTLKFRLKVKEDVIAELHGNVLTKDKEIASLKSLLDEQKNKNNVSTEDMLNNVVLFSYT